MITSAAITSSEQLSVTPVVFPLYVLSWVILFIRIAYDPRHWWRLYLTLWNRVLLDQDLLDVVIVMLLRVKILLDVSMILLISFSLF